MQLSRAEEPRFRRARISAVPVRNEDFLFGIAYIVSWARPDENEHEVLFTVPTADEIYSRRKFQTQNNDFKDSSAQKKISPDKKIYKF